MSKRYAFLFPGQGAQSVGMGKDFYESFPVARETFEEAETTLQREIKRIVFEGPMEKLTETKHSQVGIFVLSIALLRVLRSQFKEIIPLFTAGLSLGEYTALTGAEKLSFEETLKLVDKRSDFMHAACENTKGTMAAIFGLTNETVESIVSSLKLPHDLWIANYNCPGQIVISGTVRGVEEGIKALVAGGAKRAIPLKVHGAFHSGLMKSAEEKLRPFLLETTFKETPIHLVMNVPGGTVDKSDAIRSNLISQVTHSVKWQQGIQNIADRVDTFLEIGCGRVLAGLNKQMGLPQPTLCLNKVSDLEQLANL